MLNEKRASFDGLLLCEHVLCLGQQNDVDANPGVRRQILYSNGVAPLFFLQHVNVWLELSPEARLSTWFIKQHLFGTGKDDTITNWHWSAVRVLGQSLAP